MVRHSMSGSASDSDLSFGVLSRHNDGHQCARQGTQCQKTGGSPGFRSRLHKAWSSCAASSETWWRFGETRSYRGICRQVPFFHSFDDIIVADTPSDDTDLCTLSNLPPVGVICELVKPEDPEGSMARRDDCFEFAKRHGIKMISIEQLEVYRRKVKQ